MSLQQQQQTDIFRGVIPLSPVVGAGQASEWTCFVREGVWNFPEWQELHGTGSYATVAQAILYCVREGEFSWLSDFSGGFCGVLRNQETGEVWLVRDPLGLRPLFYSCSGGELSFSENLVELSSEKKFSSLALTDFLEHGYVQPPATFWQDVYEVPAGTICHFRPQARHPEFIPYWMPEFLPKNKLTFAEAMDELSQRLRQAIRLCLRGADHFAVTLSGGIDSGLVLALTRELLGKEEIKTFTAAVPAEKYDESPLAAQVAERCQAVPEVVRVTTGDFAQALKLQQIYGQPFADSSLIPSSRLYQAARDAGKKMLLTGDGADEAFGGYRRYQAMLFRELWGGIPAAILGAIGRRCGSWLRNYGDNRSKTATVKRALSSFALSPEQAYASFQRIFAPEEMAEILPGEVIAGGKEGNFRDGACGAVAGCEKYNCQDFYDYLPNDCNRKVWCANLLPQLEVRSPFFDMSLVKWSLRLPRDFRISRGRTKCLLRSLAEKYLPESVTGRTKTGFGFPVGDALRRDLQKTAKAMLFGQAQTQAVAVAGGGLESLGLNQQFIRKLWDEHQSGTRNHDAKLYSLLCLAPWTDVATESKF